VQRPEIDGTVTTVEAKRVEITTVTDLTTPRYATQGKTG
jgi:hypothetical protein